MERDLYDHDFKLRLLVPDELWSLLTAVILERAYIERHVTQEMIDSFDKRWSYNKENLAVFRS